MKKALSLLIALLMMASVIFTVPVSAYTDTNINVVSKTDEATNQEEESIIMKIIHTIFFSKLTFDSNGGSEVPYQYAFKFFGKFKAAQNQHAREIRLTIQEAEDLGSVITELLGEFYNKVSSFNESINKPKTDGNGNMLFSNNDVTMDGGSFK